MNNAAFGKTMEKQSKNQTIIEKFFFLKFISNKNEKTKNKKKTKHRFSWMNQPTLDLSMLELSKIVMYE